MFKNECCFNKTSGKPPAIIVTCLCELTIINNYLLTIFNQACRFDKCPSQIPVYFSKPHNFLLCEKSHNECDNQGIKLPCRADLMFQLYIIERNFFIQLCVLLYVMQFPYQCLKMLWKSPFNFILAGYRNSLKAVLQLL